MRPRGHSTSVQNLIQLLSEVTLCVRITEFGNESTAFTRDLQTERAPMSTSLVQRVSPILDHTGLLNLSIPMQTSINFYTKITSAKRRTMTRWPG